MLGDISYLVQLEMIRANLLSDTICLVNFGLEDDCGRLGLFSSRKERITSIIPDLLIQDVALRLQPCMLSTIRNYVSIINASK